MPKTEKPKLEELKHYSQFSVEQIISGVEARYPDCYRFTKQFEGGYVNDPNDPGGCTNMGITIGTLEAWRGEPVTCEDVKALAEPEVGLIYSTNYWAPVWGSKLPIGLNLQVWDWGVNSGPSRSIKYLQRLIGTTQDGIMGPDTLKATEEYATDYGLENMIVAYSELRQEYYESLDGWVHYGDGWTRRNHDCVNLGITMAQAGPAHIPLPVPIGDLDNRVAAIENWIRSYIGG